MDQDYYLFCHQFGNFPFRAIFLPVDLLPNSVKEDFEFLYCKYGSFFKIIDYEDRSVINFFKLMADGSPGSYDTAFDLNSFDNIDIEIPEYLNKSILYYDSKQYRKEFEIPLSKDITMSDLYQLVRKRYNVSKSIFYEEP